MRFYKASLFAVAALTGVVIAQDVSENDSKFPPTPVEHLFPYDPSQPIPAWKAHIYEDLYHDILNDELDRNGATYAEDERVVLLGAIKSAEKNGQVEKANFLKSVQPYRESFDEPPDDMFDDTSDDMFDDTSDDMFDDTSDETSGRLSLRSLDDEAPSVASNSTTINNSTVDPDTSDPDVVDPDGGGFGNATNSATAEAQDIEWVNQFMAGQPVDDNMLWSTPDLTDNEPGDAVVDVSADFASENAFITALSVSHFQNAISQARFRSRAASNTSAVFEQQDSDWAAAFMNGEPVDADNLVFDSTDLDEDDDDGDDDDEPDDGSATLSLTSSAAATTSAAASTPSAAASTAAAFLEKRRHHKHHKHHKSQPTNALQVLNRAKRALRRSRRRARARHHAQQVAELKHLKKQLHKEHEKKLHKEHKEHEKQKQKQQQQQQQQSQPQPQPKTHKHKHHKQQPQPQPQPQTHKHKHKHHNQQLHHKVEKYKQKQKQKKKTRQGAKWLEAPLFGWANRTMGPKASRHKHQREYNKWHTTCWNAYYMCWTPCFQKFYQYPTRALCNADHPKHDYWS